MIGLAFAHSFDAYSNPVSMAGAGPAGMVLGYLLARAGVEVQILEKHADFLHDFRGDTVHPSTLELMHELGVLEDLLKLPHQRGRSCRPRRTTPLCLRDAERGTIPA